MGLKLEEIETKKQHKRELGGSSYLYLWLIKNNFPEGYRVLCMNHQFIEREIRGNNGRKGNN